MTDETRPPKLACFADETGQDTAGEFFLVVAVVLQKAHEDEVCGALEAI